MKGTTISGEVELPIGASILVVDDELNLRRTLAFILQRAGYQVVTATDGIRALSNLKIDKFDLVLIDLQLPDVEGIGLADEIHQIEVKMPVILLTGHPTYETKEEAKHQGIVANLSKPIDPTQILTKVAEALENTNHSKEAKNQG